MSGLPYLGWPAFILASWVLAYVVLFRPLLAKIGHATGTTAVLKAPETPFATKPLVWLDGSKTLILSFLVSLFAMLKALVDVLSQSTDIIDDLKTNFPWATYFSADTALKIVSFSMLLVSMLHIYGKFTAARAAAAQQQ